jgi:hypothetical protein
MATRAEFLEAVKDKRQNGSTVLFAGATAARGLLVAAFEQPLGSGLASFEKHYVLAAREDERRTLIIHHAACFVRRPAPGELDIVDAVPHANLFKLNAQVYNYPLYVLRRREKLQDAKLQRYGLNGVAMLTQDFDPAHARLVVTTLSDNQYAGYVGHTSELGIPALPPVAVESFSSEELAHTLPLAAEL